MESKITLFKSQADREIFLQSYKQLLATWSEPYESKWIASDFGETHAIISGPENGEPIVLVPGAQGTAGMWGPLIPKLNKIRRVYCLDIIDQVGLSRPQRILTSPKDCARWLEQTLDKLDLSRVDLLGNSIGAFISACFSVENPERIKTLTLAAPAGTVSEVSPGYILQVILTMLWPFTGAKVRFTRKVSAGCVEPSTPLFKLLVHAMTTSKVISKVLPRAMSEAELQKLRMGVLLIVGDKDPVNKIPASDMVKKLESSLPDFEYKILKNAGHLWNDAQLSACGDMIRDFLVTTSNKTAS